MKISKDYCSYYDKTIFSSWIEFELENWKADSKILFINSLVFSL